MAKRKFYAVKAGKIPGIYQTWSQAEEQVKGFSGAEYKSFPTLEEAERYITSQGDRIESNTDEKDYDINEEIEKRIENLNDGEVIAFVDGSYSPDADGKEKYGFGAILFIKGHKQKLFKAYVNEEYMDSRNVAGEISGVIESILWTIENNKKEITIYYDYEGIEKWAKKEWKANKRITKEYSKFIDEKSKLIKINFIHTKAHTGIIYNEEADDLAKRSLLSQGYKAYNDGSIYFIGLTQEDWINIIEEVSIENKNYNKEREIKKEIEKIRDYLNRIEVTYIRDKVVINCYKGNKSYVQGKQSVLFQKIISYAIEKLPTESSVIETLNTYHALTVEKEEVENQLKNLLPNFPDEIQDIKHYNNILSAIFNTMLVGYMPDYTCLITPIFRAMDYYLHRILSDKLGNNTVKSTGKNNFAYFNKDKGNSRYYYNSTKVNASTRQIDFLDDLYNYYNKIRHPYAHWSKDSIDTPVITEMHVARDLILEGLQLVNKYYILF
ncbi:viroplasmin family protein [Peptoniphilus stercorisuis]|uniref:ribonuclease H n=1 Tax=Peptoniphilus stercorisuis TaxID=1436965 RepID=A0ABS4KBY8_9FIRM|nr:viroplasmin family protein [Peptoniphilus stercorisuis]MBP2025280.1 ribonuclease HI [Peptoniphilus stercorisuis]